MRGALEGSERLTKSGQEPINVTIFSEINVILPLFGVSVRLTFLANSIYSVETNEEAEQQEKAAQSPERLREAATKYAALWEQQTRRARPP